MTLVIIIVLLAIIFGIYQYYSDQNDEKAKKLEWANERLKEKEREPEFYKYMEEGLSYLKNKQYSRALDSFDKSLYFRPSYFQTSEPECYMGQCFFGLKNYQKVLDHNKWKDKKEEYYLKVLSANELKDVNSVQKYLALGIEVDSIFFDKIKHEIFDIEVNPNHFILFVEYNVILQLLKNTNRDDFETFDNKIESTLIVVKDFLNNPASLDYSTGKRKVYLLRELEVRDLFSKIKMRNLLSKDFLYLNEEISSTKYYHYTLNNEVFIKDLDFLRYFTNLKGLTLYGQKKIEKWHILEELEHLKELNIQKTNIDISKLSQNTQLKMSSSRNSELVTYRCPR